MGSYGGPGQAVDPRALPRGLKGRTAKVSEAPKQLEYHQDEHGDYAFYGSRLRYPLPDGDARELSITSAQEWYTCGGLDDQRSEATGVVLTEGDDRVLAFGGLWIDPAAHGSTPVSVGALDWYMLPDGRPLFVAPASWNLGAGLSIGTRGDLGWTAIHVTMDEWGC